MDIEKIKKALEGRPGAEKYAAYLYSLSVAKDKTGSPKNPWVKDKPDQYLIRIFKDVEAQGLVFDGEDITLQKIGVSYNYQAYKNKMLIAYPESIIDLQLVYTADTFTVSKESGKVSYTHKIGDPFGQKETDIAGGYCVIKNKRGEFLVLLNKADIDKHRKVAKTDYIWKNWYVEMALKTLIKKACSKHFKDVFKAIEATDNENYDLDKLGVKYINETQLAEISEKIKSTGADKGKFLKWLNADKLETIPASLFNKAIAGLNSKVKT